MSSSTKSSRWATRWLVLVVVAVGDLMLVLDFTIMNVALPAAQRDLGFSDDLRQWIITAYGVAFGGLLLLGGRLADLFGPKRTLVVGLLGFAVASAVGGVAPSFAVLVTARAAQGALAALLAPALLAVLTTTFTEPGERGKAFGVFGAVAGSGGAVGLVLGGVLTEALSWRWSLYVNLVFALPAAVAAGRLLVDQRRTERRSPDVLGTATATAGLFLVIYGLFNAERSSWDDPTTVGCLTLAIGLIAAFLTVESRTAHPLLPLRIVLDRVRAGSYLSIAATFGPVFTVFLFLSFFFQRIHGYSPIEAGLAFLPQLIATVITVTLVSAKVLPRTGPKPLLVLGLVLGAAGMSWLAQLEPTSGYPTAVLPALILLGVGMGNVVGPAPAAATHGVDPTDIGVASAAVEISQFVGGSIGLAVLSTIVGTPTTAEASVHGTTTAYYIAAGIFVAGAITVAFLMPLAKPEPATPTLDTAMAERQVKIT